MREVRSDHHIGAPVAGAPHPVPDEERRRVRLLPAPVRPSGRPLRQVRPGLRRRRAPGQLPLSEAPHHPHRAHEEVSLGREDVGA